MNKISNSELEPWLIVLREATGTSLALWRIDPAGDKSLALFSDRPKADAYALNHCLPPTEVVQFAESQLIRVFADCFRQGIRFATLNPSDSSARQIFFLRDVLKAARLRLENER